MKDEILTNGCSDLRIVVEEMLIPNLIKKDYTKYIQDFGLVEGFECMVDEIDRVWRLINFHDELTKLYSDEELLTEFLLFINDEEGNEKRYSLYDEEKQLVEKFLKKLYGNDYDVSKM